MTMHPTNGPAATPAAIPLKRLMDRLVNHSMAEAFYNRHHIVNEMPESLTIAVDEAIDGPVIRDLFSTVVSNARNGDIHISADQFRNVITLRIEDRNNYNGYALESRLQSIAPDALKIGGHLQIDDYRKLVAVVSLSLPC